MQDFTLTPVLTDVPQALWGKTLDLTQNNPNPPQGQLLSLALTGLLISPIPRHPDMVSNIVLAILIFQQDHKSQFLYSGPAIDTGFTVSGTPSDQDQQLTITITPKTPVHPPPNSPLPNQAYRLAALEDAWIQGRRNTVLDALQAEPEFNTVLWTKDQVNMPIMAQKALTNWPAIALLGN